jgi:hypothetical protein
MSQPKRRNPKRNQFVQDWLVASASSHYQKFSCTILAEADGVRDKVKQSLCETVFIHHNDPKIFRRKLEHLGYPEAAKALDRRPKPLKTRLANFGEILASEVLRQIKGYSVPVYRLRYNMNDDSSPKGDDVLAFEFDDGARGTRDTVIVAEAKVRKQYQSAVVEEAHEALLSGQRPRAKSFMFVVDVLYREGKVQLAERILDFLNKCGPRRYCKRSCLFLVTGNQPRDAFGCVEQAQRVAPGLEAFQLTIDDLHDLVKDIFEAEVDADGL